MVSAAIVLIRRDVTRTTILLALSLYIIASAALAYMDTASVGALGSNYFDDDGTTQANCDVYDRYGNTPICDNSEIRQVIGETQYVRKTGTKVRAYFSNNRGQITVDNFHWCPGNAYGDSIETEDNDQGVAIGENVLLINIPGTGDVYGKRYNAGDGRCDDNVQVNLAGYLNDGTAIGLPGLWYADLSVQRVDAATGYDGIQNAISLRMTSGAGFAYDSTNDYMIAPIGHVTTAGAFRGTAVTLDARTGPANYGLKVRFGTNCNITTAALYNITFYDLDGADDGGAQKNGAIRLKLKRESPTGVVQWLASGANTWQAAEPAYADAKIAPSVANADWDWDFYAHPDYQYELQVLNIYSNNTIQLSTPFDNIYGVRNCDRPNAYVRALGIWDKTEIEAGETATFTTKVENHGSRTGYVLDTRRQLWRDDGDSVLEQPNGADLLIGDFDYINAQTAVPVSDLQVTANAVAGDATYPQICGRVYSVVASNPVGRTVDTVVTRAAHQPVCVKVAKYPAMVVRGGDVRAGGAVPKSAATCTLGQLPLDGLSGYRIRGHYYRDPASTNPNKAFKGAYVAYGAITPGPTQYFGSANEFYKGSGTPSSRGIFGSQNWGAATYGYGSEGYYLGGTGVTSASATHCLPDVQSFYPASSLTRVDLTAATTAVPVTTSANYVFAAGGGKRLDICVTAGCTSAATTLAKGQRITIRITQPEDTNVNNYIALWGSVNYPVATTTYASIAELPQFTIIVDKPIRMAIKSAATNLAGLIGTTYNLHTCEGYDGITTPDMTTANCPNTPLTITGATIVGGKVYPFRTDGFDTRADGASFAETFTLGSQLLLSDYYRAQQQKKLRVDFQTDLPSRF